MRLPIEADHGLRLQAYQDQRKRPGEGPRELRTFDDVGAFILINVEVTRQLAPHWTAVQRDLIQARFGARRAEVHQGMRDALSAEGWLE